MKKYSIIPVILIVILNISYCFSETNNKPHLTKIINIAAKQRMLVQRLAKNKVYLEIKENKEHAKKEMHHTIKTFEKGIKTLKHFSPTEEINHKIQLVEFSYNVYKKMIKSKSKESTQEVVKYNTLFLNTCEDLLRELLDYSKSIESNQTNKSKAYVLSNISKATAASGKLRYLTQRLNLYYILNSHNIEKVSEKDLHKIIRNIEQNLNYLTILEFNTTQIDDSLSEVIFNVNNLKETLYKNGKINKNAEISPKSLYKLCNLILNKANQTTKLYADLGINY